MTNPYTWPPRPQLPRPNPIWARKGFVLTAFSVTLLLGILVGLLLGINRGAGSDATTDSSKSAGADPSPTITATATATARAKPAPTVTATQTVTITAQPAAGGNGSGSGENNAGKRTGVQFGYACSPVGTLGTTEDGRPAKCFMGDDGRTRWGYDSNRG